MTSRRRRISLAHPLLLALKALPLFKFRRATSNVRTMRLHPYCRRLWRRSWICAADAASRRSSADTHRSSTTPYELRICCTRTRSAHASSSSLSPTTPIPASHSLPPSRYLRQRQHQLHQLRHVHELRRMHFAIRLYWVCWVQGLCWLCRVCELRGMYWAWRAGWEEGEGA